MSKSKNGLFSSKPTPLFDHEKTTLTEKKTIGPSTEILKCGAKTRAGTPCKRVDLYKSGRCKFHGGLSTGPKTEKGKAQSRENGKLGGRGRIRKPNPTKTLTKPPVEATVNVPNIKSLEDEARLGQRPIVRCRDCANVSAASSCLIKASGQTFPMMGELRTCAYFLELS